MEEDGPENPLSSLQYHTLMVLGTEDYPSTRTMPGPQRQRQGAGRDGQMQGGDGKAREEPGSRGTAPNTPNTAGVKHASSFKNNNNNVPDALRQREYPAGSDSREVCPSPALKDTQAPTQGCGTNRRLAGGAPPTAPVSLEYCSSPVPRLTDPAYDHVRRSATASPCPPGVPPPGPSTQTSSLTGSSGSSLLPSLTPQSSLSSGSHLEFSSPASWSSVGSSRTPCVSSISSTDSVHPCGRDLPPHCLYSHDKVPQPVPVAGASPRPRAARPRRAPRPFDCESSSSEKTLVGSKHDSTRMLGSGGNSGSLLPNIRASIPVYENPSELDSEYYYKSPKGKAGECRLAGPPGPRWAGRQERCGGRNS